MQGPVNDRRTKDGAKESQWFHEGYGSNQMIRYRKVLTLVATFDGVREPYALLTEHLRWPRTQLQGTSSGVSQRQFMGPPG